MFWGVRHNTSSVNQDFKVQRSSRISRGKHQPTETYDLDGFVCELFPLQLGAGAGVEWGDAFTTDPNLRQF